MAKLTGYVVLIRRLGDRAPADPAISGHRAADEGPRGLPRRIGYLHHVPMEIPWRAWTGSPGMREAGRFASCLPTLSSPAGIAAGPALWDLALLK